MSLKEFREALLERILIFLWRQWSALGILGDSGTEEEWIIDPEPLLIFSLEMARYEPRLFDEILAWLIANGDRLDTARLRRLLPKQDAGAVRVIGGALQWSADRKNEYERKWRKIIDLCDTICQNKRGDEGSEALFKDKSGKAHPRAEGDKRDPSFALFHVNRPLIRLQKPGKEVPVNAQANLRFLLRALFGGSARSEAILYLLTHEGGRPRDIADSVGLFWLSIHQALLELTQSGLVLTRSKGKKVEYWLSHRKWWEFLASSDGATPPKWLNWVAIFSALLSAWKTVDEIAMGTQSDYMKSSKLHDSLEIMAHEFARAGYDISKMPRAGLPPDLHQKMALRFLGEIIGMRDEAETAV